MQVQQEFNLLVKAGARGRGKPENPHSPSKLQINNDSWMSTLLGKIELGTSWNNKRQIYAQQLTYTASKLNNFMININSKHTDTTFDCDTAENRPLCIYSTSVWKQFINHCQYLRHQSIRYTQFKHNSRSTRFVMPPKLILDKIMRQYQRCCFRYHGDMER